MTPPLDALENISHSRNCEMASRVKEGLCMKTNTDIELDN